MKWWDEFKALEPDKRIGHSINASIFLAAAAAVIFTFCQLRVANKTLEGTTRAWVVVGDDITMECPVAGQAPAVQYYLVNSGNRPAVDVRSHTAWYAAKGGPELKFPGPKYADEKLLALKSQPSISVLGPGQKQYDKPVTARRAPSGSAPA